MKKSILALTFLLGFNADLFAADEIVGTWSLNGASCASGAPISPADVVYLKLNGTFTIIGSNYEAQHEVSYKANAKSQSKFKQDLEEVRSLIAGLKKLPIDKETQEMLKDLNQSEKVLLDLLVGKTCSSITRGTYYLRGSTLYTNDTTDASTCNEIDDDMGEEIKLEMPTYSIHGDTLTLTNGAEVEEDSACAVGDRIVLTYSRNK